MNELALTWRIPEKSEYGSGSQFVIPKLEDAKNFIEAAKNGAAVSIGMELTFL